MNGRIVRFGVGLAFLLHSAAFAQDGKAPPSSGDKPVNVWPGKAPGETSELGPEHDSTGADGRMVAGRRVTRLADVSTPTLTVFKPTDKLANGTVVLVCPGGGFRILAWDLEGTEVAEWLNSIGVTAVLLKYRVPARDPDRRWLSAVQDAQRAISLIRSGTLDLGVAPRRIGILGFSAGGQTAGMTALLDDRQYDPVDNIDVNSCRPDFAVLAYTAGFHDRETGAFPAEIQVTKDSPPMFLVHAHDDRLSPENSVQLYLRLKRAEVPAELHVYSLGGHGFGLRKTRDPVTTWPARCQEWLEREGLLASPAHGD